MNIETFQQSLNSTLQSFVLQVEHFANILLQFAVRTKHELEITTIDWYSPVEFTGLQSTLLKVLFVLLLGTCVLIAYSWTVYGQVITEKFVRPSTLKEIEELKLSVAKLKLPKEHSPRI